MKKLQFIGAVIFLLLFVGCMSYEEAKQLADSGNAEMQLKVAEMLLEGDGVIKDTQEAEKYLIKSINQGNIEAACLLIDHIRNEKKGDKSELFQRAYNFIWNAQYTSSSFDTRYYYPEYAYKYAAYLKKAGYNKSSLDLENKILAYKRDKHIKNRNLTRYYEDIINSCRRKEAARLAEIKRQEEIKKQAEAARLAKIKRQEEIKKQEQAARLAENNWAAEEEKRAQEIAKQDVKRSQFNISEISKIRFQAYIDEYNREKEKKYKKYQELKKKKNDFLKLVEKRQDELLKDNNFELVAKNIEYRKEQIKHLNDRLCLLKASILIDEERIKKFQKEKQRREEEEKKEKQRKIAFEKKLEENKFPLQNKIHTPIKLYKNIYSGLSKEYFEYFKTNYKHSGIRLLWEDVLQPVSYNNLLIELKYSYEHNKDFIFLNKNNQIEKLYLKYGKEENIYNKEENIYNKYAFLIGISFDFTPTQNITLQTYIDKFLKDYPGLKQYGKFDSKIFRFSKNITYEYLNEIKIKLGDHCISKGVNYYDLPTEIRNELITKYIESSYSEYSSLPEKKQVVTLKNDNVEISFTREYSKASCYVDLENKEISISYSLSNNTRITIKDVKLMKYRETLNKNIKKAIDEYNKKANIKQKQKELEALDF